MKFRMKSKIVPIKKVKPTVTTKLKQVDTTSKVAISIRLDQDIIDWFKAAHPTGYQSAINQALLGHIDRES